MPKDNIFATTSSLTSSSWMWRLVDNMTTDYLENYCCFITEDYTCILLECSIRMNV